MPARSGSNRTERIECIIEGIGGEPGGKELVPLERNIDPTFCRGMRIDRTRENVLLERDDTRNEFRVLTHVTGAWLVARWNRG